MIEGYGEEGEAHCDFYPLSLLEVIISQQPPKSAPLRLIIPDSRSFLICFSTPRDDMSIFIAISAADILGSLLIKSRILSELLGFLSELFVFLSELLGLVSELLGLVSELLSHSS